jgi:hypothetical protein
VAGAGVRCWVVIGSGYVGGLRPGMGEPVRDAALHG